MSEPDKLVEQIKRQLNDAADDLDAKTQLRLTKIRHQILDSAVKPKWSWQMPALALGATAAVAVITISLMWSPASLHQTAFEDISLLSANEAFELIDDVEFYEWLSEEQQNG